MFGQDHALATRLEAELAARGIATELLDGDIVRRTISADLGFSPADRVEQARRVAEAAAEAIDAGRVPVIAVVAPTQHAREQARAVLGDSYLEVFVDAPVELCRERDVKGMYREAHAGRLPHFTGVSAPYEPPRKPALRLDTAQDSPGECVRELLGLVRAHGVAV